MPRAPRRPGTHQDPRNAPQLAVVPGLVARSKEPPPLPSGIRRKKVKQTWGAFWRSAAGALVDVDASGYRIERWIRDVNELEALLPQVRREPMVAGSKGQPRMNPLFGRIDTLEKNIKDFEQAFGLTLKSGLDVGLTYGELQKSAAEANARIREAMEAETEDPELAEAIEAQIVEGS